MKSISISFISVAFNSSNEIEKLIKSIKKVFVQLNFEIIIVDNSSCILTKNICELNNVVYMDSGENVGFSKACNNGARVSSKDLLFFINPDSEFNGINQSIFNDFDENSKIIYIPNVKEIQFGDDVVSKGMLFPLFSEYLMSKILRRNQFPWYRGSALLLSRQCFFELNGWNEHFFMYAEDLDLFYRAKKLSYAVKNVDIFLTHDGGMSSDNIWDKRERQFIVDNSLKKFYCLHRLYVDGLLFYSFFIFMIAIKDLAFYRIVSWYKAIFKFSKT